MARRFAKVSEEEIVAINEAAFFHPPDLVNAKTTFRLRVGEVYPPLFTSPSWDSSTLFTVASMLLYTGQIF